MGREQIIFGQRADQINQRADPIEQSRSDRAEADQIRAESRSDIAESISDWNRGRIRLELRADQIRQRTEINYVLPLIFRLCKAESRSDRVESSEHFVGH